MCEHFSATDLAGTIAVVKCDKPPVGTLAAMLEHNLPSIIMSDGPIHPDTDPKTGEKLDVVSAFQVAGHPDLEYRHHIACHACPGFGSCGGMFTYNTMQTGPSGSATHARQLHRALRRETNSGRTRIKGLETAHLCLDKPISAQLIQLPHLLRFGCIRGNGVHGLWAGWFVTTRSFCFAPHDPA